MNRGTYLSHEVREGLFELVDASAHFVDARDNLVAHALEFVLLVKVSFRK